MSKPIAIGSIVFVVGLIAGGFAWYQLTRPSIENDEVAYYIAAAGPIYRELPRLAVEPDPARAGDFESALLESLMSAEVVGVRRTGEGGFEIEFSAGLSEELMPSVRFVTPTMHERLLRAASEILSRRFATDDADQYIEYRESNGAILSRSRYDKHFPHMFEAVAARVLGDESVENATPRSVFETLFDQHIPNEVATGEGMAIAYGIDSRAMSRADLTQARLGYTGWSGGLSLGVSPMTTASQTRDELLDQFGPLAAAAVGVVTYYPDRSPRPMALWFIWHPAESRWMLIRVMLMNFPSDEAMAAMFPEF